MVTVTNLANGASTSCLITDTEESGWPRIIDMDTSVFSAIAGPQGTGAGVLNVSVSW
jgi:rare lipoprotein A (peptidoglycan hydrolase)